MLLDQILTAQQPVPGKVATGGNALAPQAIGRLVPHIRLVDRADTVRHRHVPAGIELLRVQPLPPFAPPLRRRQLVGVIALAGARPLGVIAIGGLVPVRAWAEWLDTAKRSPVRVPASPVPIMSLRGPTRVVFRGW